MQSQRSQRLKLFQHILIAISGMSLLLQGVFILKVVLTGSQWSLVKGGNFFYDLLFTFTVSSAIFAANLTTVRWLDHKMPWREHVKERLLSELVLTSLNAILIMTLWTYLYYLLSEDLAKSFNTALYDNIIIALVVNTIATSIMEGSAFYNAWKSSIVESERLQKENLRTQYEALKSQVNPHFLFNSLNTLSSLVHTDPDLTEEFIDEFARFYRYILEIKDKSLVSLQDELSMMESYVYLQKIRFGKSLIVDNKISQEHMASFLPPLSLQILVENAIKHNALSLEQPLKISLEINHHCLRMTNNLQKRDEDIISTGIGLHNLTEKYRILSSESPKFYAEGKQYTAIIPLLQNHY